MGVVWCGGARGTRTLQGSCFSMISHAVCVVGPDPLVPKGPPQCCGLREAAMCVCVCMSRSSSIAQLSCAGVRVRGSCACERGCAQARTGSALASVPCPIPTTQRRTRHTGLVWRGACRAGLPFVGSVTKLVTRHALSAAQRCLCAPHTATIIPAAASVLLQAPPCTPRLAAPTPPHSSRTKPCGGCDAYVCMLWAGVCACAQARVLLHAPTLLLGACVPAQRRLLVCVRSPQRWRGARGRAVCRCVFNH
jgi:hypothetical protein